MKKIFTKMSRRSVLLATTLLMVVSMASCDFSGLTDAADDFAVIIGLEPINTSASVFLIDAESENFVSSDVDVTFGGDNGSDVIDIYSDPLTEEQVESGVLSFGIQNSVTPSSDNPATITLNLSANGYKSTTKTLEISEEGSNTFYVRMINENNKPQGVKTETNTEGSADEQGTVQSDFTASATSDEGSDAGASIGVASGSRFQDADGNSLTGQLTTNITYYNPNEVSAMTSIPVELEDDEGNPIVLAGMSEVSITDANGRSAASVTASAKSKAANMAAGEISYTFRLPASATNQNGQPYQVGDVVTLLTIFPFNIVFDETVEELEGGGLGVIFNTDSVPRFVGVGWAAAIGLRCSADLTLNRNGNSGTLFARLFKPGFAIEFTLPASDAATSTYTAHVLPQGEFNVEVTTSTGAVVSETKNICGGETTLDLPAPSNTYDEVAVEAALQCDSGDIQVTDIPMFTLFYKRPGEPDSKANTVKKSSVNWNKDAKGRVTGGSITVNDVVQNTDYEFSVEVNGDTYPNPPKVVNMSGTSVSTSFDLGDSSVCSD